MKYYEKYGGGYALTETTYTRLNITAKLIRFYNTDLYTYAVVIFDNNKNKITLERDYKTFIRAREFYRELNKELLTHI